MYIIHVYIYILYIYIYIYIYIYYIYVYIYIYIYDIINIFHDFKVMFIQLNEATNHTVHVSNHGALSTFIALSEALKGGFIMTYVLYITCFRGLYALYKPATRKDITRGP